MEKKGIEYPRAVEQLQNVIITCKMAVPDGEQRKEQETNLK